MKSSSPRQAHRGRDDQPQPGNGPAAHQLDDAEAILKQHKVEKLLLVDERGRLAGLITMRDIERSREFPQRCSDARGRLRVGAALGVHDYERAAQLIAADVDVLVLDTAHGHSDAVIETVKALRKQCAIEIIAAMSRPRRASRT